MKKIPGVEAQKTAFIPGNFFVPEKHLYQSEECRLIHDSLIKRISYLERMLSDHEQRFDTLQTPFWKRIIFWIDGWPWHNLNGEQKHRPWHGDR